jgi:hypothetical protein
LCAAVNRALEVCITSVCKTVDWINSMTVVCSPAHPRISYHPL